jgi:hypothetical protein
MAYGSAGAVNVNAVILGDRPENDGFAFAPPLRLPEPYAIAPFKGRVPRVAKQAG